MPTQAKTNPQMESNSWVQSFSVHAIGAVLVPRACRVFEVVVISHGSESRIRLPLIFYQCVQPFHLLASPYLFSCRLSPVRIRVTPRSRPGVQLCVTLGARIGNYPSLLFVRMFCWALVTVLTSFLGEGGLNVTCWVA